MFNKKEYNKQYNKQYKKSEKYKLHDKMYKLWHRQTKEYKAWRKAYIQTPNQKARMKAYQQRPEVRKRLKIYNKKYGKKYRIINKEKINAYRKKYFHSIKGKQHCKEYRYNRRIKMIAFLGNKCCICHSKNNLQFHHKNKSEYGSAITWKLINNNGCLLLCKPCHAGVDRVLFWKNKKLLKKALNFC